MLIVDIARAGRSGCSFTQLYKLFYVNPSIGPEFPKLTNECIVALQTFGLLQYIQQINNVYSFKCIRYESKIAPKLCCQPIVCARRIMYVSMHYLASC